MPKIPKQGEVFIEDNYSGKPGFFKIFKMTPQGMKAYFQDNPYEGQRGEQRTAGFYQPSTGKIFQSGVYTQFVDSGQTLDTDPKKYNTADIGQYEMEQGLVPSQRYTEKQLTGEVPKMGEVGEKKTPASPLGGAAIDTGRTTQITPEQYQMTQEEMTTGEAGQRAYTERIARLRAGTGVGGAGDGSIAGDGGVTTGIKPEGMPDDIWNMLTEEEKSFWTPMWSYLNQQLEAGKEIPPVLNAAELAKLWDEAKADPVIKKFYADQLKIGETNLTNTITDIALETGQWSLEQAEAFRQERKQLSEAEAAAGRAYSGFRQQAKSRLQMGQTGIVESTKRRLGREVRQIGQQFEQKFGTTGLPQMGIPFADPLTGQTSQLGYTPYGGISGTAETGKLSDIEQRYQDLISKSLQQKGAFQQ